MSSSLPPALDQPWQRAWSDAERRIPQLQADIAATPSPHARITRVGKVDAELLDAELIQLLKEPLTKALNLANSTLKAKLEPELTLLIHLVLYKFSVWDHGASYGAKLQGLKYMSSKHGTRLHGGSGLPRSALALHGVLTILVPYIHNRIRTHALSNAWPDAPSSDRRRKAWELLTRIESIHGLAALLNFVVFLWNGRYRTIADRLLRLRLVAARRNFQREVSYEFMNRQMVWHAFTEFLLFLLPLINTRALRRQVLSATSRLSFASILPASIRPYIGSPETVHSGSQRRGKYWSLPEDQCAICAENASTNFADPANALTSLTAVAPYPTAATDEPTDGGDPDQAPRFPIQTPYITSCGHVYCYYCLTERMMRTADDRSGAGPKGTHWECLRCAEGVIAADRVEAQAEGPDYLSGVDDEDEDDSMSRMSFEFGSEDADTEFTDMSGSMGSYTDNGSDMSSE
ncbi:peroxisomal biogenesis factor 2 [Cubamyces menziesii]|nr:peroxisomal biogenesis factor 2 [Cubamyces menziesii]